MPTPNLPKPVTYTVTVAGVGKPILGSRYREAGTVLEGNPHLYGPYVAMGHLAIAAADQPTPKTRAKREIHQPGRTEPTA
jgi:hypothetical protein